jgi:hypothetical protein
MLFELLQNNMQGWQPQHVEDEFEQRDMRAKQVGAER